MFRREVVPGAARNRLHLCECLLGSNFGLAVPDLRYLRSAHRTSHFAPPLRRYLIASQQRQFLVLSYADLKARGHVSWTAQIRDRFPS